MFSIPNISQLTTCASQFFKSKISSPQGRIAAIAFPIIVILGTIAYRTLKNRSNKPPSPPITEKPKLLNPDTQQPYQYQPENPKIFHQIDRFNQTLQLLSQKLNSKESAPLKREGYNIVYDPELQDNAYLLLSQISELAELGYQEISKLKKAYPGLFSNKADLEIAQASEYIHDFVKTYLILYQSMRWGYLCAVETSFHFSDRPFFLKLTKPKAIQDSLMDHQKLYYQENTMQSKARSKYNEKMKVISHVHMDINPPSEDPARFQDEWKQLEISNLFYLRPILMTNPNSGGK